MTCCGVRLVFSKSISYVEFSWCSLAQFCRILSYCATDSSIAEAPPLQFDAICCRLVFTKLQEVVRFCRTMNAPAAGLFCQGELGPLPTLVGGILPNTSRSRLQAFSTCTAVLYWNPAPAAHTGDWSTVIDRCVWSAVTRQL